MRMAPRVALSGRLIPTHPGYAGVFHTLRLMRQLVDVGKVDPQIINAATGIIFTEPERDQFAEAKALFAYVRDYIRYQRDVLGIETIAPPALTLARAVGDCDDQTTLLAALLESVGYITRFVVAGYESKEFEHVYLEAWLDDSWVAMDPTEREPLGYAPPCPIAIYREGDKRVSILV